MWVNKWNVGLVGKVCYGGSSGDINGLIRIQSFSQ